MPEEPPPRPPPRGGSILSDTDGEGSDDDDLRLYGDADSASTPNVAMPHADPDSDDDTAVDDAALDAQIEALRHQIAAGRLTPSAASNADADETHEPEQEGPPDPVNELLTSERWGAGRLAAADDDTLDALIDRLAKSRPLEDPMSQLEREEAAARRMKVQTDLMRYLHELRRRAEVDFPPDFAELVEELVANATKRDEQLRAVGLRGRAEGAEGDEGAEAGTSKMPNPWTNQEPGLDMIATEDLDPKIRAGLEKIRKYDEMLLAKEAEQRMVEQETLDRGGDPNEDGGDGKEKDGDGSNKDESGDDNDKQARLARRRKRRLRKIARLRRTLRGEDAEDMGGAAARNAAAVAGVDRLKKLSEEEDALAERLLAEFSRDEEAASVVESSAFSVKSGATNVTDTTSHNPFAVPSTLSLLASINHPGTGGAGGLNQVGESPVDEQTRRLAEIERALGAFKSTDDRTDAFVSMTTQMRMGAGSPGGGVGLSYAGGGESPGDVAVSERPLSAATGVSGASPAPSSASAFARRHGLVVGDAEKENAGGGGSAYLESAREERELKEVSEEVDLRLRRMKTKGEFPARLTPEEMRALVDECRSEQGA